MRNLHKILGELHLLSAKSKSETEHFEKLGKYITAKNYAGAAHHIATYKSGLLKNSPYHTTLLELLEHYQVKSPEDAELRLKKLILAIKIQDGIKINTALETGSLIVMNESLTSEMELRYPYQANEVPLMAALAEGDKTLIELLLNAGANLDNASDINAVLNKNGETALHIACRLNLPNLIIALLQNNADPNIRDKSGKTPLHNAVSKCDANIQMMLLNKGADPTITYTYNGGEVSAFHGAYASKHIGVMQLMIQKGYKLEEIILQHAKKHHPDIYRELKAPYKKRKQDIIYSGPLSMFVRAQDKPSELTPLYQAFFAENKGLAARLIPPLERIYNSDNEILKPLLDLGILAAQGRHESGVKVDKKLKVILVTNTHVGDVQPGFEAAGGLYNLKHTIYSSDHKGAIISTLGTILHELKHFADQQIYGSAHKPFFDQHKDHFMQVKARLEKSSTEYLAKHAATAAPDDIDVGIYRAINSIFTGYKPSVQDAEVLVKVPEIIGYLGVERGVAWLQKNEPALLKFYIHRFNPACQAYIDKHQAPDPTATTTHKK